jgi:hypothetical protein
MGRLGCWEASVGVGFLVGRQIGLAEWLKWLSVLRGQLQLKMQLATLLNSFDRVSEITVFKHFPKNEIFEGDSDAGDGIIGTDSIGIANQKKKII